MEQWHRHGVGSREDPKTPDSSRCSEVGRNSRHDLTAPSLSFHGVGLERLTSIDREPDRWFVSAGVRTKAGVTSLFIGGGHARIVLLRDLQRAVRLAGACRAMSARNALIPGGAVINARMIRFSGSLYGSKTRSVRPKPVY